MSPRNRTVQEATRSRIPAERHASSVLCSIRTRATSPADVPQYSKGKKQALRGAASEICPSLFSPAFFQKSRHGNSLPAAEKIPALSHDPVQTFGDDFSHIADFHSPRPFSVFHAGHSSAKFPPNSLSMPVADGITPHGLIVCRQTEGITRAPAHWMGALWLIVCRQTEGITRA